MFATYQRLKLHTSASNREVIAAARKRIARKCHHAIEWRDMRKQFYRDMLNYHEQARGIVAKWRLF